MATGDYVSRLHLVGIATLAVLTAGLASFAWSIRPGSGGFPGISVDTELAPAPTLWSSDLTEVLTHTNGAGAVMTITAGEPDANAQQRGSWYIDVNPLGSARLCTPRAFVYNDGLDGAFEPAQHVTYFSEPTTAAFHEGVPGPSDADAPGTPGRAQLEGYAAAGPVPTAEETARVHGSGPVFMQLCWSSGGPVSVNGAYLSAQFLPVEGGELVTGTGGPLRLARQLNLGSGTTSDFSIQSLYQPSTVTSGGWQWSSRVLASYQALTFSAVNTSETQHDSYQAFLSGIVFGVAGGALVALVQELVAPFRSRKELRPPEPGG